MSMKTVEHPHQFSILIIRSIIGLLFYIITERTVFTLFTFGCPVRSLIFKGEIFHFIH